MSEDRTLPTADKYTSCPSDGKILDYYKGQFKSVYILHHPFIKPNNCKIKRFHTGKWPSKHEIINYCSPVLWNEVIALTDQKNISEIDVGLRTSISSLNEEYFNEDFVNSLNKLYEDHEIISPEEGEIPPLLENRVYEAILSLGYKWLWVGDEFCTERKLFWIDDLIKGDEIPNHGCVFTPDKTILVTTHWVSHCFFICSSKSIIDKMLRIESFEGFFCTYKTEVYWGCYEI